VLGFRADFGAKLASRWLLNEPVVMFRKHDGEVVALSGLCPHRFFPLAESRLQNDTIVCGYHGITFDGMGTCVHVPGQNHIPETCRLRRYPVAEHGMWVWVWAGDPDRADRNLLPDLKEIGYEGPGLHAEPFYFYTVNARYQLLNDNLLDLSHLAFLHRDNPGAVENAGDLEETTTTEERVVRSRRRLKDQPVPPLFKYAGRYGDTWDQVFGADFYPPGLHVGIGDFCYSESADEKAGQAIHRSRFFHTVTPSTTNSCYYHFGMSADIKASLETMRPYMMNLIKEDIFAAESIETMLRTTGTPAREVMKKSDRTCVAGRRMMEELILAEQAAAHDQAPSFAVNEHQLRNGTLAERIREREVVEEAPLGRA
jgi:vanillate O-demethylase monooxygenase subunit